MICIPFASLLRSPLLFPLLNHSQLTGQTNGWRERCNEGGGEGEREEVLWLRRTDCGIAAAANCLGISLSHYSQQQCKALFSLPPTLLPSFSLSLSASTPPPSHVPFALLPFAAASINFMENAFLLKNIFCYFAVE